MNRLLPLTILFVVFFSDALSQNRYVIQLTDKNNSPYSISNPSAYLSPKAIARRSLHNIAIDQSDLPVNPAYVAGIAATGVYVISASKWLNTVTILCVNPSLLASIQALPYVAGIKTAGRPAKPGQHDQKFDKLIPYAGTHTSIAARNASFNYGPSFNQIHMMNGEQLHNGGYRGENMTIAVLDAGFLNVNILDCFDSLRNEGRILGTYDFVDLQQDVYGDDAHGAMVLSLMAGNIPDSIIGTAPKASYWLLRSEDANSEYIIEEYNWATAAEFADSVGADLINTSLGYTDFWDSTQNHTYLDMDGNTAPVTIAADMAASKGILVECSAGNEGNSSWNYISAPADGDSVLATGAVDSIESYASFSSNGPSSDGRVKPDVAAQGANAYVYYPWAGGVGPGSGTSFSGPIMTGMAACLWQAFPNMANMDIIQAIKESASQYNNPDTLLGYGIPDFAYAQSLLNIKENGADYHNDQLVSVYPNPFAETFTYSFFSNTKQEVTLEIFDMLGKLAYRKYYDFNAKSINRINVLPHLQSHGVYILRLRSESDAFTWRIIRD